MNVAFDLDVDVRCVACGAECSLPEGVERVLEADGALYACVAAEQACVCGGRRVRVEVSIGDGCNTKFGSSG